MERPYRMMSRGRGFRSPRGDYRGGRGGGGGYEDRGGYNSDSSRGYRGSSRGSTYTPSSRGGGGGYSSGRGRGGSDNYGSGRESNYGGRNSGYSQETTPSYSNRTSYGGGAGDQNSSYGSYGNDSYGGSYTSNATTGYSSGYDNNSYGGGYAKDTSYSSYGEKPSYSSYGEEKSYGSYGDQSYSSRGRGYSSRGSDSYTSKWSGNSTGRGSYDNGSTSYYPGKTSYRGDSTMRGRGRGRGDSSGYDTRGSYRGRSSSFRGPPRGGGYEPRMRGRGFRPGPMDYTNNFSRGRGMPRGRGMRGGVPMRGGFIRGRGMRGGYGFPGYMEGYGYEDEYMQQEPEKDKSVVYFNFPSAITGQGAADLMEFGNNATWMHFGWKCCFTFESEEVAREMETKLAEMEFNGQKPNVDISHRDEAAAGEGEKRPLDTGEEEGSNSPKRYKSWGTIGVETMEQDDGIAVEEVH